ncbi:MAG: toprim domain-containing protein [Thermoplasmatota archaeon]
MTKPDGADPTLDEALASLMEAGEMGAAVLVEGEKDETALRVLGFEGVVLRLHTGERLVNLFERIAHERKRVILLVDWDRKGGHLARLARDAARANDVTLDETHRRRISRAVRGEVRQVEALVSFLDTLERRGDAAKRDRVEDAPESNERGRRRLKGE